MGDPTARFEIEVRAEPCHYEPGAGETGSESTVSVASTSGAPAEDTTGILRSSVRTGDEGSLRGPDPPVDGEDVPEEIPEPEAATLHLAGSASGHGVVVDDLTAALGGGVVEGSGSWSRDEGSLDGSARVADVQLARLPWRRTWPRTSTGGSASSIRSL